MAVPDQGKSFLLREGRWTFFFFKSTKDVYMVYSFGRIWWPLKRPGVYGVAAAALSPSYLLLLHLSVGRGQ